MNPFTSGVLAIAAAGLCFPIHGAEYHVTGPQSYESLTVFLIHGPDRTPRRFLTLQEALLQKKAVVYETGQVNELAIENLSKDEDVYIQSGDIVKGGRQDRTLKEDVILGANSGRVGIESFCVEHSRWTGRGNEPSQQFAASPQMVSSKGLKMAVRAKSDQAQVWNEVARAQDSLALNLGEGVRAPASPSSLMLSLENGNLARSADAYVKALEGAIDGQNDVIGYAFAINGKVNSADLYASNDLFRKLWPRLLRAAAVEAIADPNKGATRPPVAIADVLAALHDADQGRSSTRSVNSRTSVVTKETGKDILFETRDNAQADGWIHRSYLTK